MMRDELIRAAVVVPVAALIGLSVPGLAQRWRRGLLASGLVVLALVDHLGLWQTWVVAAMAGVAAVAMPLAGRGRSAVGPPGGSTGAHGTGPSSWRWAVAQAIGLAALATGIAVIVIDRSAAGHALASVADRRGVVLVLAGGITAVFIGGEIIARVLHPFAMRLDQPAAGMENAGRVIGWLERTLLYALVLAGAPDAAALVIAGKSIARFPSFTEESFAEYYLIGSLMSLVIAAGVGIAVRAALGLSLLPSAGR